MATFNVQRGAEKDEKLHLAHFQRDSWSLHGHKGGCPNQSPLLRFKSQTKSSLYIIRMTKCKPIGRRWCDSPTFDSSQYLMVNEWLIYATSHKLMHGRSCPRHYGTPIKPRPSPEHHYLFTAWQKRLVGNRNVSKALSDCFQSGWTRRNRRHAASFSFLPKVNIRNCLRILLECCYK